MSENHQEVEVKIHAPDLDSIREKLEKAGAKLIQERIHERNMRYDVDGGTLTAQGIVVRLRQDVDTILTYKGPSSIERGVMTREELEVTVSDYDTMELMLARFGYEPYMFYEKYRTTYELNNAHIMLDELPFGNFFEIEGTEQEINVVLDALGMTEVERRPHSYSKLFDYVKHHLELDFVDLTFENFADIDVPESAFIPPGSIVVG